MSRHHINKHARMISRLTHAIFAFYLTTGFKAVFGAETGSDAGGVMAMTNALGVSVTVEADGKYSVGFAEQSWNFSGSLAQVLTNRTLVGGRDNEGVYSEITFIYSGSSGATTHKAGIRLYKDVPCVTFDDTMLVTGDNDLAFPQFTTYPVIKNRLSFGGIFTTYHFGQLFEDSFWLFFEASKTHQTFIISPATNYMVSAMVKKNDGSISCGINVRIQQLPAGFNHRVILVAENGINQTYKTWGDALLAFAGKTPPANDAAVELNKLGYWTDNGSVYAYNPNPPLGFEKTLMAIRDEFENKGAPLGYVQLDSWFYPKGVEQSWNKRDGGIYRYMADAQIFPEGLAAFQRQLGLPLMTQSRWIDTDSPYRTEYPNTHAVVTDIAYWKDRMAYLKEAGVVSYEQDWMGFKGTPLMNLTDGPAYLNNMAAAAAADGINLQYCMIQGRHFLQGSLYTNLMTIRVSQDRFSANRWNELLFGSRAAQAMGIWPWADVFWSSETRNLLLATLSAGPVGVGDALGSVDAGNLLKSVRPDGVIVKPDVPLTPVDDEYVNEAQFLRQPFMATTYSDNGGSQAIYVFAYGKDRNNLSASFKPVDFGITNNAYVYDYFAATGAVVNAGGKFDFVTSLPNNTNGGSYCITVPVGKSGIALVGDINKFVTRGKKRITDVSDDGVLKVAVVFAKQETPVTLCGYAPSNPMVKTVAGAVGDPVYDTKTHLFTLTVKPDKAGVATIALNLKASSK